MSLFTRSAAAVAGTALLGSLAAVLPAGTAQAASDPTPAKLAASWMAKNVASDGLLPELPINGTATIPSVGLTLDLAATLRRVPGQETTLAKIRTGITNNLATYTMNGSKGSATANALAWAVDEKTGTTVAGLDLLGKVKGMVLTTGPAAGMIDDGQGGYASTWTQIWGAKGLLADAGSSALADQAVGFLAKQQCPSGVIRDGIATDGTTCTTVESWQGGDTTALALAQLAPYRNNPAVKPILDNAARYLLSLQDAQGGFADPSLGVNANSTGLAGLALGEYGNTAAATKAASWLRSLQATGSCYGKLSAEPGAVAYDSSEFTNSQLNGIAAPKLRDQWIRVGTQVVGALTYAAAASAGDSVTGPKFAQKNKSVKLTVAGLAAGERACVGSTSVRGTGQSRAVTVKATSAAALTLRTATGTKTANTRVLAPVRLAVKAPAKAKKGAKIKVTVKRLAAGEKVTIKLRGKKVAAGKANARGTFTKKVKVGKRAGKAKLTVTGQYSTRNGKRSVTVR